MKKQVRLDIFFNSLWSYKVQKLKELNITNLNEYTVYETYIKNDIDRLQFLVKHDINLPISKYPYIYIYNGFEIFFILSFLDFKRKSFDIMMKKTDYLVKFITKNLKSVV